MNIEAIQAAIRAERLDGWLFFDHHQRDPLAYRILQFKPQGIVSRRWYYFIPAFGEPVKLAHRVEPFTLDALPGSQRLYSGWREQRTELARLLGGARRVAMQYSPQCAIPYVAMVDAGTIELIRELGVEIASSADLVQYFEARWTRQQFEAHLEAGRRVDEIRRLAFEFIGDALRNRRAVREWDVQTFIISQFAARGLVADHGPNVSVNANASNPHYEPHPDSSAEILPGAVVLIDLWAKLNQPDAVYYDITWMGFCGANPPSALENVFDIVREARDRAIRRVQDAAAARERLRGFQVDDAARSYIEERGYGDYFFHRTGHSIGVDVHGTGANMDNLETHDDRSVIPYTCFSIEPGIYLGDFGVRSEVNVFVDETSARVTGEKQERLVLI
jgi:Xaa-Pro aminopeptidase